MGRGRAAVDTRLAAFGLMAALCLLPAAALATATVKVQASPTRLTLEEELQVNVQASGTYDELTAPTSDGFDFRQTSHQTQVSIVGRQMERVESFVFTGTPRRVGMHVISPVEVLADGRVVARSQPLRIEVAGEQAASGPAQSVEVASNLQRFAGKPFFVRPALSVASPFVGQPFVLTWELYWTRMMRVQGIRETGAPKWGTFDNEDLLKKGQPQQEMVQFGGNPYIRQITHQVLLSASAEGKQRIDGPSYRIDAGDVFEMRQVRVGGEPIELNVRPVPQAGRLPGYVDGNVGKLKLTGRLTLAGQAPTGKLRVGTGERLLLEYTVEGEGNLLNLKAVKPPAVAGMAVEELPNRAEEGVRQTLAGIEGKRTWQYVVSFAAPGSVTVPAVAWAAFDPYEERFTSSEAGPFEVAVTGAALAPATAGQAPTAETAAATGAPQVSAASVLRPLAATAELARADGKAWVQSRGFWWLALSPWLGALALLGLRMSARRRARGQPQRLRAAALGDALRGLEQAAALGPSEGYAALRSAVAAYLQRAFDLQSTGLTEHVLAEHLRAAGVDVTAVDQLTVELAHCDYARFAPGGDRETDLAQTATRLATVLERIDARALSAPSVPRAGMAALLLATALLAGLAGRPAQAATLDETFAAANRDYVAGRFKQALEGYESLLRHDLRSAAVQYNLANTLVKDKQLGRAIGHFKRALALDPNPALRGDIQANMAAVRAELSDQARRKHATLHVFDESPELDVALARAAPTTLLALLALLGGFGALVLLGVRFWHKTGAANHVALWSGVALCVGLHLVSLAWLWHAQRIETGVQQAVIVEEDAALTACQGVSETMGLPEGLEVRKIAELPDGRIEVRLPNGREGCVAPSALYAETP